MPSFSADGPAVDLPMVTLYVVPTGDDTADGSAGHPLRTLHEARNRVRAVLAAVSVSVRRPAVDVLLGDGVFELGETLVLDARDSGHPDAPVRWTAAPGAAPVLAGGRRLQPHWQPWHGDVVTAQIDPGLAFDQLFADGRRQILARYPNVVPGARLDGFAADATAPTRVATWSDPTTAQVRALHLNDWGGRCQSQRSDDRGGQIGNRAPDWGCGACAHDPSDDRDRGRWPSTALRPLPTASSPSRATA